MRIDSLSLSRDTVQVAVLSLSKVEIESFPQLQDYFFGAAKILPTCSIGGQKSEGVRARVSLTMRTNH